VWKNHSLPGWRETPERLEFATAKRAHDSPLFSNSEPRIEAPLAAALKAKKLGLRMQSGIDVSAEGKPLKYLKREPVRPIHTVCGPRRITEPVALVPELARESPLCAQIAKLTAMIERVVGSTSRQMNLTARVLLEQSRMSCFVKQNVQHVFGIIEKIWAHADLMASLWSRSSPRLTCKVATQHTTLLVRLSRLLGIDHHHGRRNLRMQIAEDRPHPLQA
jgi:hypothetical protein